MFNLLPPIFIRDEDEKKKYIDTLSSSFKLLEKNPKKWNTELSCFFDQEIERIRFNASLVYEAVKTLGEEREK